MLCAEIYVSFDWVRINEFQFYNLIWISHCSSPLVSPHSRLVDRCRIFNWALQIQLYLSMSSSHHRLHLHALKLDRFRSFADATNLAICQVWMKSEWKEWRQKLPLVINMKSLSVPIHSSNSRFISFHRDFETIKLQFDYEKHSSSSFTKKSFKNKWNLTSRDFVEVTTDEKSFTSRRNLFIIRRSAKEEKCCKIEFPLLVMNLN